MTEPVDCRTAKNRAAADLHLLGAGGEPDLCLMAGAAVALGRAYAIPFADALRDMRAVAAKIRDFSAALLAEDSVTTDPEPRGATV